MHLIERLYKPSLALLTDLYQLTMAYGYWKEKIAGKEAVFHLFFRQNPFQGGYAVMCGTALAADFIQAIHFDQEDVAYLKTLTGNDGKPLFEPSFLDELVSMKFSLDVDGVPEGTVIFPHEPLLRVKGPLIQCQLLETALLNIINFQTLIATKAARVARAARQDPVLEFGLRRAQGIDGGISASRAAYIGGCAATSNVLAGRLFGIPVKGTHAHSWIMCFDSEPEAFVAYADAMPNNSIFLVDTYDTLQGVKNAVEAGKALRRQGHEMVGIRLDSGDLATLSIEARKILDEGGFPNAVIVASNDLDEHQIADLKKKGAAIGVWGVGTKLATAYDQPALGGVYKLSGIREEGGEWAFKVKLSEEAIKGSNPGILQVRRFSSAGQFIGDVIFNEESPVDGDCAAVGFLDDGEQWNYDAGTPFEDLLCPIFKKGRRVWQEPPIVEAKARTARQLAGLSSSIKGFEHPGSYAVGLEKGLYDLKEALMEKARVR